MSKLKELPTLAMTSFIMERVSKTMIMHCILFFNNSQMHVGLILKHKKCELNKNSLTFFGFVFSSKGILPVPGKVKVIHDASLPEMTKEVKSFWAWPITYIVQSSSSISVVSQKTIEGSYKKDVPFQWVEKHKICEQDKRPAHQ